MGQSYALISDAVNSLGDVFTSVAVLLAFRVAQKPADAEHPYGHTRAEAIAGSNVAVLVIVSALLVGWGAIRGFSGIAARGSARLDAGHRRGQRRDQGSAFTSTRSGWAVGPAQARSSPTPGTTGPTPSAPWRCWSGSRSSAWADQRFLAVDEIAALFVVAVILTSATQAALVERPGADGRSGRRRHSSTRSARRPPRSRGSSEIDKLWVRKSGLEYLVDIHIQVRADQTVDEGHRISHLVKDELLNRFANVRDVLVHLEPYPHVHDRGKLYSEET